jgi:hypothetical protein
LALIGGSGGAYLTIGDGGAYLALIGGSGGAYLTMGEGGAYFAFIGGSGGAYLTMICLWDDLSRGFVHFLLLSRIPLLPSL